MELVGYKSYLWRKNTGKWLAENIRKNEANHISSVSKCDKNFVGGLICYSKS